MTQVAKYQMRRAGEVWIVYMVEVDGEPIPVARQPIMFSYASMTLAQGICHALNNGMLEKATRGLLAERAIRDRNAKGTRR